MDTSRSAPTPEEVAEAIADAEPVDWPACESSPAWPAVQIDGLRRVEAVAAAFRTAAAAPLDTEGNSTQPPPLFVWGPLEVFDRLGEGSFGEVFRARDPMLQRDVALKLHHRDDRRRLAVRSDFIGEARRLARVRHPNVVVVHGADEHDGRIGLWLDLIDGCTLTKLVRQGSPLSSGEATAIAMDLCGAVAAVHAAGLVHGDIKPSNVMRERGGRIVLMDFGAGIDLSPDVPAGPVCGTPAVMAPEILRGDAPTPASDLYSLGALLYFLLTGSYPVEAKTLGELMARQQRANRCRWPTAARTFQMRCSRSSRRHSTFPRSAVLPVPASCAAPSLALPTLQTLERRRSPGAGAPGCCASPPRSSLAAPV